MSVELRSQYERRVGQSRIPPSGKLLLHVLEAVAAFEAELIKSRTEEGEPVTSPMVESWVVEVNSTTSRNG